MNIIEALKASKDGRIRRRYWRQGDYIKDQDGRSGFTASWTDRNAHLTQDNLCFEDWEPYEEKESILSKKISLHLQAHYEGTSRLLTSPPRDVVCISEVSIKTIVDSLRFTLEPEELGAIVTYLEESYPLLNRMNEEE